jgi:hypothetical protein
VKTAVVESNKEDIALLTSLSCYCTKAYCGILDTPSVDKMIDASVIQTVNESEDEECCDEIPIDVYKHTVCPPDINIRPKYKQIVGDPVPPTPVVGITYGFYWFELVGGIRNTDNPTPVELLADIAAYPSHYILDNWLEGMQIEIDSSATPVCYHVVVVPISLGIKIFITDEGGGVVNNDWTILADTTNTYYLFKHAVAPGTVKYLLTENV